MNHKKEKRRSNYIKISQMTGKPSSMKIGYKCLGYLTSLPNADLQMHKANRFSNKKNVGLNISRPKVEKWEGHQSLGGWLASGGFFVFVVFGGWIGGRRLKMGNDEEPWENLEKTYSEKNRP